MSNKDTFKQLHEQTLLLLKKHKNDMINYNTIVCYLNKFSSQDSKEDTTNHVLAYSAFLYMELYTIRNHSWIKENKFLFDIFDESQ